MWRSADAHAHAPLCIIFAGALRRPSSLPPSLHPPAANSPSLPPLLPPSLFCSLVLAHSVFLSRYLARALSLSLCTCRTCWTCVPPFTSLCTLENRLLQAAAPPSSLRPPANAPPTPLTPDPETSPQSSAALHLPSVSHGTLSAEPLALGRSQLRPYTGARRKRRQHRSRMGAQKKLQSRGS